MKEIEYTRTDFLNNFLMQSQSPDALNDRLYMGNLNFEVNNIDNLEINDIINITTEKLNYIFKSINLDIKFDKRDTIPLLYGNIVPMSEYVDDGKVKVSIPIADIYRSLETNHNLKSQKMCSVFRLETVDGNGFYQHFSENNRSLNTLFDLNESKNPSPLEDGALKLIFMKTIRQESYSNYRFGFSSKEQLEDWIGAINNKNALKYDENLEDLNIFDLLDEEKIYFAEYEVSESDLIKTQKQAFFNYDRSKLISKMPCIDYFNNGLREKIEYNIKIEHEAPNDLKEIKLFLKNDDDSITVVSSKKKKDRKKNNNNQLDLF